MPKSSNSRKPNANACQFCFTVADADDQDNSKLGKLHTLGKIRAHYYCLLFCSNLSQSGKYDHHGILGFMPKDITAELRRGRRLRCCYCKLTGATLGCSCRKCPRAYHLPCGLKNNIMLQFFGTFPTYCSSHRFFQEPIEWKKNVAVSCSICLEEIVPEVSADTLYPPCCKNGWFHKNCVQRQALIAGYFFRCPLCNNQTEFNEEMEKFGIYIPEKDASWETEPGAFSEMNATYSRCDAPKCLCPQGRDHDSIDESPWEVILCKWCVSHGTHIRCSKLSQSVTEWVCPVCLPTDHEKRAAAKREKKNKVQPAATSSFRARLRARNESHSSSGGSSSYDDITCETESQQSEIQLLPGSISKRKKLWPTVTPSFQTRSRTRNESHTSSVGGGSSSSYDDVMCETESPKPEIHQECITKRETDFSSSGSSSPICVSVKVASPISFSSFRDPYRDKQPSNSSSDSDLSDNDRKLGIRKCPSPTENQADYGNHQKQNPSPKFALKRSASFRTSSEASTEYHPLKKPYSLQTADNPFSCSSWNNETSRAINSQLLGQSSGDDQGSFTTKVFQNASNSHHLNESASLVPYTSKPGQEIVITLSDSEEDVQELIEKDEEVSFSCSSEDEVEVLRGKGEEGGISFHEYSDSDESVKQLEEERCPSSSQLNYVCSTVTESKELSEKEDNIIKDGSQSPNSSSVHHSTLDNKNSVKDGEFKWSTAKTKQLSILNFMPHYVKHQKL